MVTFLPGTQASAWQVTVSTYVYGYASSGLLLLAKPPGSNFGVSLQMTMSDPNLAKDLTS